MGAAKPPAAVSALVAAGGRGSRLGGADKLYLELGGRRLAASLIEALARDFGEVLVASARPEAFAGLPARVIGDEPGYGGPLAALLAGLREAEHPWLFFIAVDMPGYDPAWAAHLAGRAAAAESLGRRPAAVAAAQGPYFQPFQALYHRRCLGLARSAAGGSAGGSAGGRARSPQGLLAGAELELVPEAAQAPFKPERLFININTMEDLAYGETIFDGRR